jgi:YesN/AraC family two-component response regulator
MCTMNYMQEAVKESGCDTVGSSRTTLLVVEDDAMVRLYLHNILKTNYRVITAAEGREGIRKAKELIPHLIVSDVFMPLVDGYRLCMQLKQDTDTGHIPIILLTCAAGEDDILRGLEAGADDYITKPIQWRILLARIQNLLHQRRLLHKRIKRRLLLESTGAPAPSGDEEFLQELLGLIEKHISDPRLNIDHLAAKLYMSRASLYRKIHSLTGEAPANFIRTYRLKRAAQLFKKGCGNVTEVAIQVGVPNVSYFTKIFKKKFGQVPSRFLQK